MIVLACNSGSGMCTLHFAMSIDLSKRPFKWTKDFYLGSIPSKPGKFMPEGFVTAVDVAITCATFFQFYFLNSILSSEDKIFDLSFLLPIFG